ncbi:MAG: cytochrome ubiquinol oxidase subunit I [Candidatus Marinimicrobia bacterium]|nr:cytochrome ubiquinol oxidase subunit I [Candidatus Neomarinimicrobiota bacterium]
MVEWINIEMVNWARALFALTAMYHWVFVPLTLGLSWLIAFYETIYYKTGDEEWARLTKFWMRLFGINFALGVATGIILEFEFGTNWSNYSWMVGDIFGAPLAIEGIAAFFIEATFFAVMFFGWNRVSKRFHLASTYLVAIGSNLSALWILVANAWMQYPVGMTFNPDSARFEMQDVLAVILSPVAVSKFTHTTSSSFLFASLFVISVSSWFLLKGRHLKMAQRSILVAAVFGLVSSIYVVFTGDEAAFQDAKHQPMKLAAFEGHYAGARPAGLTAFGILNPNKQLRDDQETFYVEIQFPRMLSILAKRTFDGYVPGLEDLIYGNTSDGVMGTEQKMVKGKLAVASLAEYKAAKASGNREQAKLALGTFRDNEAYFGYGFFDHPEESMPSVGVMYYSFHIMVGLGFLFIVIFMLFLFYQYKGQLEQKPWLLKLGVPLFFFGFLAQEAGWLVAEMGRQPWAIQGMLPVSIARTNLDTGTVAVTFFIFLILFTILLTAEIKIMLTQIKIGPEEAKNDR